MHRPPYTVCRQHRHQRPLGPVASYLNYADVRLHIPMTHHNDAGRPTEGDRVVLTSNYQAYSDARDGPMKSGDVGVLIEDDGSSQPFKVRFGGRDWWYVR